MWQLLAIVIWLYFMFYWLAFIGTIYAWLNVLLCLLQGHFIRAGFWFAAGGWALMWWFHDNHPEQDLSFDKFVPWALTWMAIGACFTGVAWLIKRKIAQAEQAQQIEIEPEVPLVTLRVEPGPAPKKRRRKMKPITLVERNGVFVPENGEW